MALWINLLWNNSFVNLTQLPLLCEKTGILVIVELGLTAGRPLSRQKYCKVRNCKFYIFDF